MKALILAAGQGTRLGTITDAVPKPMVAVSGRPVLDRTLERLAEHGFREVVINLHHRPEVIRQFCGDGAKWGMKIHYSPEVQLQGTAGALRPWRAFFDETFLLVYGDNLSSCNYSRLIATHRARAADATMALFWRSDPSQSGIAEFDEEGWVRRFAEKPPLGQVFSHWVNAGVIVLEPHLIDTIPPGDAPDFGRDVLPQWSQHRRLLGYRMSPDERLWWIDTPEDLERVQAEFRLVDAQ